MDAPEDTKDIKLYRASADLLPDISRRLDKLLDETDPIKTVTFNQQLWVADSQLYKLISLVSSSSTTQGSCADRSISARSFSRMAAIT
jgi:hypothetical protein